MFTNSSPDAMRQSIFTRPLEQIPAVRNALAVCYVVFLVLFVAFTQFPELYEPKNWPRIREVLGRWALIFGLGFGGLSALISFVFGFLPDHQTRSGHRACIRWLAGAAVVAAVVAIGFCVVKAF